MKFGEFAQTVQEYEKDGWFADRVYLDTMEELGSVQGDVSKLTVECSRNVIRMFLVQWGSMARVVNQKSVSWEKITQSILDVRESFGILSEKGISDMDHVTGTYKDAIIAAYSALYPSVKATATSKILRALNPKLFVIWDARIRSIEWDGLRLGDDAESYSRFLNWVGKQMKEVKDERGADTEKELVDEIVKGMNVDDHVKELCQRKSLAKLADEYCWWKAWKQ